MPEAIRTDQVPHVPERITTRLARYQNVKSASFADWNPSGALLFASRIGNVSQLYTLASPGAPPVQITTGDDPVAGGTCLPDGSILFSRGSGGDENFQIYKLAPGQATPVLLTDGKSRNLAGPVERNGRRLAFTSTRRNGRDADIYSLDLEKGGPAELILQVENETWSVDGWSEDGTKAIVTRFVSANESHPHVLDLASRERKALPLEEGVGPGARVRRDSFHFGPGDRSLYFTTDASGEYRSLVRLDLSSGKYAALSEDLPNDVEELESSRDGKLAAFTVNSDGYSRLFLLDLDRIESGRKPAEARREIQIPRGVLSGIRFRRDARELGLTWGSASSPGEAYSLAIETGKLTRWTESDRAGFSAADFVEPELIQYSTFDGRHVPAFVFRPPGKAKAPVIVSIHGGPESQSRPTFSARVQAWVRELGAAVIVPNVRGSTGYGKTYSRLDDGILREDSVRDIGALLDWIAKDDLLDATRVAVAGGSYGGYMVLASLVNFGARIKAGVDVVGISSFRTFLENTSAYRRDLRRAEYGDERDPKLREFFDRISPASRIHELRSALFLVHGDNDPRVPISEAKQIVERARSSGQPVWTLYASNEGHGFTRRENSDYQDAVTILFLERHLLGKVETVTPTRAQADWQDLEFGVFCHFGINTFHAMEWSDGKLDARTFKPASLDAEQWVKAAREAGAGYFMLTAKHHDGFCLWPTATTDYSVRSSPWKDGKGDVVREVQEACEKHGLKLGLYLSPWDRHEPSYVDKKAYDAFYLRQLEELVTGYGPLVEVWFDGAGSEGREYDWAANISLVRKHQPDAMIFNMGAPTIRWSGNELGHAPEPNWNAVQEEDVLKFASGKATSDGTGSVWLPAECDVPIRDGWFWRAGNSKSLKSLEDLIVLYYRSIGRGANLLLNIAPDDRGLWPDEDLRRLGELGAEIRRRFGSPLATAAGRGGEILVDLGGVKTLDHVISREDIREGQRVRKYVLEARSRGNWLPIVKGTTIGHKKIDVFPAPMAADAIRLRVLERIGEPIFQSVSAFSVGEMARDGAPPSSLLAAAETSASAKDFRGALELVDQAVSKIPAWPPAHLLRARLRGAQGDAAGAVRDLDLAITLLAPDGALLHQRAIERFKLGQFKESAADFERSVELGGRTHTSDECWERGLARYYAGDFEGGRKQFEGYHRVGPLDIENGLWWLLCVAEKEGLEKGRAAMPAYAARRRPPFPALMDLYLGKGSVEAVFKEAGANPDADTHEEREEDLFYAHLYVGEYLKVSGQREEARKHFQEALQHPVAHFMYWCAKAELR